MFLLAPVHRYCHRSCFGDQAVGNENIIFSLILQLSGLAFFNDIQAGRDLLTIGAVTHDVIDGGVKLETNTPKSPNTSLVA